MLPKIHLECARVRMCVRVLGLMRVSLLLNENEPLYITIHTCLSLKKYNLPVIHRMMPNIYFLEVGFCANKR
jgi:hypothetical protein